MVGEVEFDKTTIEPEQTDRAVCGFWRRIVAFLIDFIILAIFGSLLGVLFFNQLTQLGPWGWLVGFFIALLYFGVLNSSIGNGQSIGKKVLQIRVVDKDGELIDLKKSFMRAAFISIIICSNGLALSLSGLLGNVIDILIGSLLVGLIYFYIFNRKTRQALHDIMCDTYVYRADALHKPVMLTTAHIHYVIYTIIFGVLFIGSLYAHRLSILGKPAALEPIYGELSELNGVYAAVINMNHFKNNGRETVSLKTTVYVSKKLASGEETKKQVARIILEKYPDVLNFPRLDIYVNYGYNIGFASGWKTVGSFMAPWEWKEKLQISKLPGEKPLPRSITNTVAEKIFNDIKFAYNRGDDKSLYNMMGNFTKNSVTYRDFKISIFPIRMLGNIENIGNASYTHYTYAGHRDDSDWFILCYSVNYNVGRGNAYVTIKADNEENWEIVDFKMNVEQSSQ